MTELSEQNNPTPAQQPDIPSNPYVGPRTFDFADRNWYFGREREARDLLSLVIAERLVLFYAQSGAGKSSLLNVRLIPGLREQARYLVLPVARVGGELPKDVNEVDNVYAFNLMLSIDRHKTDTDPNRFAHMTLPNFLDGLRTADGLHYEYNEITAQRAVARRTEVTAQPAALKQPPHVLIVDQFEEIVTSHPEHWRARSTFFQQLADAMRADPLLWVVLTLREDFVASLDPFAEILPGRLSTRFYMERMGIDAALAAIQRPAENAGRPFDKDAAQMLVDNLCQVRIAGQARTYPGQYVEPVQLQVVCYQLWENLKTKTSSQPNTFISIADLQQSGNVDSALADFYDQAIQMALAQPNLTISEQQLRDWFDEKLITEADTRGTVYRGAVETEGIPNQVIQALEAHFLLRTELRAGGSWVELVHDRFIGPIQRANRKYEQSIASDQLYAERMFISRIEAANSEELAQLVLLASAEEEKIMRTYLGSDRFRRMRNPVIRRKAIRPKQEEKSFAKVVFIPELFGSELTSIDRYGHREHIWLSLYHIVTGQIGRLRLNDQGVTETDPTCIIQTTGIMKRYYGEILLTLAEHFEVQAFWYDWRKDFRQAAAQLHASINNWFTPDQPVHLVAHGAGGLIARAYIQQYPQRWALGHSKCIMIGTPNHGTFAGVQTLTGHAVLIRWLELLSDYDNIGDLHEIIKSFPSLYQILPSQLFSPSLERLYQAETYGSKSRISQSHLNNAKAFHQILEAAPVDRERMIYLAGNGQPTPVGINVDQLTSFTVRNHESAQSDLTYLQRAYLYDTRGDGLVPHSMGVLTTANGQSIPAYYIEATHGDLCSHPQVLLAIKQFLALDKDIPPYATEVIRRLERISGMRPLSNAQGGDATTSQMYSRAALIPETINKANQTAVQVSERFRHQTLVRSSDDPVRRHLIDDLGLGIEDSLVGDFLSGSTEKARETYQITGPPIIKINLVAGDITNNKLKTPTTNDDIDAIGVGHYSGTKPQGLLRQLDYKISIALARKNIANIDIDDSIGSAAQLSDTELIITQFTQRGTIRAELAQTFFLTDPRNANRLLVIAGMGKPGHFGPPELTVLARELCWSVGLMGKRHLGTVLIGTGRDNLSVADAVNAWMRGINLAISGMSSVDDPTRITQVLQEITFFISNPRKLIQFDAALVREQAQLRQREQLIIFYRPLEARQIKKYVAQSFEYIQAQQRMAQLAALGSPNEPTPSYITTRAEGIDFHFGALTSDASISERAVPLDPILLGRANDDLAAAGDPTSQLELGEFMQRLLIPSDLHSHLATTAPIVIMLDSSTARIHWELLAHSDIVGQQSNGEIEGESYLRFWGTSSGVTRQLLTTYTPMPNPSPPARRHLRVLIVADPAADAHLPGAEEEGIAVADLFEEFNIIYAQSGNSVEVTRLFGPREATRTAVLRHLMMRTYDVLHFAGHTVYDAMDPARSGFLFSNGERLSAYEFTRIDHSPQMVFANACESGLTPDRSFERSVDLAPSFAQAFSARGVSNFVCAAWPVDDKAARDFALSLYAGLLGLTPNQNAGQDLKVVGLRYTISTPLPMHSAMLQARRSIALPPNDIRSWGAYQHYGNPDFRFFAPEGMSNPNPFV